MTLGITRSVLMSMLTGLTSPHLLVASTGGQGREAAEAFPWPEAPALLKKAVSIKSVD
jgi:hypothetical protein